MYHQLHGIHFPHAPSRLQELLSHQSRLLSFRHPKLHAEIRLVDLLGLTVGPPVLSEQGVDRHDRIYRKSQLVGGFNHCTVSLVCHLFGLFIYLFVFNFFLLLLLLLTLDMDDRTKSYHSEALESNKNKSR